MKAFKDNTDREWQLALTVGAARRVKDTLGVDLLQPLEPRDGPAQSNGRKKKPTDKPALMAVLDLDVALLVDVLFVLCKPAADTAGVSDVDFGEALGPEQIIAAHDAFFSEWLDFFHLIRRPEVAELMTKQLTYMQAVTSLAAEKMQNPEIDKVNLKKIDRTLGESLKNLQGSPGSTPTRSRGAKSSGGRKAG